MLRHPLRDNINISPVRDIERGILTIRGVKGSGGAPTKVRTPLKHGLHFRDLDLQIKYTFIHDVIHMGITARDRERSLPQARESRRVVSGPRTVSNPSPDSQTPVDNKVIITGSFNFTKGAEEKNAENLLIIKDQPELVKQYIDNYAHHKAHSEKF